MENRKKILLVEDDRFILELYATKFSMEGFEVFRAEDGQEGVELFKKNCPDVVLLDIKMPRMDGWTTLKEMKKVNKSIPIIMFTNLGDSNDIKEVQNNQADDYLIKSLFTPEEVVLKIRQVLKQKNERK